MKTNSLIETPCTEDWNKMKIGLASRHCESCCKDVYDFTAMEREEIILHLIKNAGSRVCGRVRKVHVDYSYQELSITIDSLLEKNKNTNLAFYILTIGSLMLSGCDDRNEKRIAAVAQASQQPVKADNETRPQSCAKDSVLVRDTEETMLVGTMTVVPEDENTDEPRTFVMRMPEFKGGIEALNHFIQSNLKYPEWERKNGIEGNVFVSFVIERSGKISDAKIIKSVAGSRGFDAEVLSVISKMPPWTPGVDYGREVAVRYVLPMKFAL